MKLHSFPYNTPNEIFCLFVSKTSASSRAKCALENERSAVLPCAGGQ